MPNIYSGEARPVEDARFAIVVARYNEAITGKLLAGALETFASRGVPDEAIDIAWVPGAWEVPLLAQELASRRQYAAVVCLGAVIRGETTHDQHINTQVSQSLGQISLTTGVPLLMGVLTCNTYDQAAARAGGAVGNKGSECALAALEMASLLKKVREREGGRLGF